MASKQISPFTFSVKPLYWALKCTQSACSLWSIELTFIEVRPFQVVLLIKVSKSEQEA